jgi:hypothetical protein
MQFALVFSPEIRARYFVLVSNCLKPAALIIDLYTSNSIRPNTNDAGIISEYP